MKKPTYFVDAVSLEGNISSASFRSMTKAREYAVGLTTKQDYPVSIKIVNDRDRVLRTWDDEQGWKDV